MTRKHFEQIAGEMKSVLSLAKTPIERCLVVMTIESMVPVFEDANSRFDRVRFLKACGV